MSWTAIAQKDFRDAVRSRTLLGLTLLFVAFTGGFIYIYSSAPQLVTSGPTTSRHSFATLGAALIGAVYYLVPLIGLIVGYKAIVGERTSGSIRFLFSFPHTRADLVFGKLVGRTAVVAVALVAGFLAAGLIGLVESLPVASLDYVLFVGLTVLLAFVFVSIAISVSALFRSSSRALSAVVGTFVLLYIWPLVPTLLRYVVNGFSLPSAPAPTWAAFVLLLSPEMAYQHTVAALIPKLGMLTDVSGTDPFYLQNWFGFVILVAWVVVPLAAGYARFERMDL